jgi:hypothetical protein
MKKNRTFLARTGLSALLFALAFLAKTWAADVASDFPYVLSWEAGDAEFAPGDSITINQVRGTAPTITTGATYCIEGVYTLASRDEAKLSLFATTKSSTPTRIDPQQTMTVARGSGAFRLVKTMNEDGFLHVSFYPVTSGSSFGGVYFGQGEGVLRNKGWSAASSTSPNRTAPVAQNSSAGANQTLFEYLGNPVEPPTDLDPKYTRDGLSNALQTAVQKADVWLQIHIEDSEFPFLVGLTGPAARQSYGQIMAELKQMGYADQGSVGSDTCQSMNIVPWSAFPRDSSQRIGHRLTVRQQMFFDRLTSSQPQFFYVSGEVKFPSRRAYTGPITVSQAIAACGGLTDLANRRHVELIRLDGRKEEVDWAKASNEPSPDPIMDPGDKVHVGRRVY